MVLDAIISNKETLNFLKKHFISGENKDKIICGSWENIPLLYFTKLVIEEYTDIIESHMINDDLLIQLRSKM